MSDPILTPGGSEQQASGAAEDQSTPKKDTVAYETHLKLLKEKKKLQEDLERYQSEARQREEADLRAKEDFKKIAELREAEAKELREKLTTVETRERNMAKLDAFLTTLDGSVDKRFWGHIPLDKIIVDPVSGEPDPMSVAKEVEWFRKEYFDIIKKPGQATVPVTAPQGASSANISYEEWLKLPLKEQKARMKDVMRAEQVRN